MEQAITSSFRWKGKGTNLQTEFQTAPNRSELEAVNTMQVIEIVGG